MPIDCADSETARAVRNVINVQAESIVRTVMIIDTVTIVGYVSDLISRTGSIVTTVSVGIRGS